jgi:NADPH-dependent 2,4-dienoyl-CoA reductase/sulfur reductase-like enzyme
VAGWRPSPERTSFLAAEKHPMPHVLIVGGGFAGMNAAKILGRARDVQVTLVDRRNHHLFQPLLYQVAMAGLSPADIAAPIRGMLSARRGRLAGSDAKGGRGRLRRIAVRLSAAGLRRAT